MLKIIRILLVLFLFLVLLLVLVTASIWVILRSPQLTGKVIPPLVNSLGLPARITRLQISGQDYRFPGGITLRGVQADISVDQNSYQVAIAECIGKHLEGLLSAEGRSPYVSFRDAALTSKTVTLSGTRGFLQKITPKHWAGEVHIAALESQGLSLKSVSAVLSAGPRTLELSDIKAVAYDGTLTGRAAVNYSPLTYSADLLLEDWNAEKLETLNPGVFSNMRGSITLDLTVAGPAGGITVLTGDARLRAGSRMNAALLGPLVQHVPKKAQSRRLKIAVEQKELIRVNVAQAHFFHKTADTLGVDINLKSPDPNLDIQLTLDVNLDSGLSDVLTSFKELNLF